MPITPTYPGVYVEEIPSGVRTITGVATSITAFIGRAERGPVDDPVTINCFADFERVFGGLWEKSALGYAVRDFFLNGGSQAIVVRLFHPDSGPDTATLYIGKSPQRNASEIVARRAKEAIPTTAQSFTKAILDEMVKAATTQAGFFPVDPEKKAAAAVLAAVQKCNPEKDKLPDVIKKIDDAVEQAAPSDKEAPYQLRLKGVYKGSWGNNLRARIDHEVPDEKNLPEIFKLSGLSSADLFNLTIHDAITRRTEVFRNVTVPLKGGPRNVKKVVESESLLVLVDSAPEAKPSETDWGLTEDEKKPIRPFSDEDNESSIRSVGVASKGTDGSPLMQAEFLPDEGQANKKGLYALEKADLFNMLCIPPYKSDSPDVDPTVMTEAAVYCDKRRAMLLLDPPAGWANKDKAKAGIGQVLDSPSKNAAIFFPRLRQPDPLHDNQMDEFVPCGAVAGVFARTDAQRGVWKAPAGLEATLVGVPQLTVSLTDAENGELNPLGINCLRAMPAVGRVVWGSRTLQGADRLASEWKYIPVRRTALFIEESLYRGTQWVVFEPNDEPLWAQIRLNIGAFMHNLFRQGAFQGKTPRDAYFVKCDKETTTQNDINLGIVNILVGFAPLKPAEFVIIKIQQMAGQIEV